jgi:N-acetyl sugar amidotransferase
MYNICCRCVMDTSDDLIVFNKQGICDHCLTFDNVVLPFMRHNTDSEVALNKMVDNIKRKGKGQEFDCIIGLSGGIDSSYLALLAKKCGLRPLLFHVDAGWNSQEAVNNIEKLVDGLGFDLFTEVIDWDEMKDLQLAFFKSGVSHIDAPQDHAFFATMYKFAEKYNVKSILTGANLSTECIRNPVEWMYYQSDSRQLKDIHDQFGSRPLKNYPTTSILRHKIWLPYIKGIKVYRLLDTVRYNKNEAIEELTKSFGWQRYPQKHFESRFTRFYEGYWLPKRFGYDTRRVQFSSLILTGQMLREQALEILAQPALEDFAIRQEFEYVANKLAISCEELQKYLQLPKKTYRDYKSQRVIYNFGANVLKAIGIEVGGKR